MKVAVYLPEDVVAALTREATRRGMVLEGLLRGLALSKARSVIWKEENPGKGALDLLSESLDRIHEMDQQRKKGAAGVPAFG